MSFNDYYIFSSGGHFDQQNGNNCVIWQEQLCENLNLGKRFKSWCLKIFFF